jgi:hypothetical protein
VAPIKLSIILTIQAKQAGHQSEICNKQIKPGRLEFISQRVLRHFHTYVINVLSQEKLNL